MGGNDHSCHQDLPCTGMLQSLFPMHVPLVIPSPHWNFRSPAAQPHGAARWWPRGCTLWSRNCVSPNITPWYTTADHLELTESWRRFCHGCGAVPQRSDPPSKRTQHRRCCTRSAPLTSRLGIHSTPVCRFPCSPSSPVRLPNPR